MGFAMVIVLLPFGLYYLLFVSSQINYFTNRNFRVLAEIGNHISAKIDNQATILINLAEKTKQEKSSTTKVEGKSRDETAKATVKQETKPEADVQKVKAAVSLVPGLKFDPAQYQQVKGPPPQQAAATANTAAPNRGESPPVANANRRHTPTAPTNKRVTAARAPAASSQPRVTMSVKPEQGSFWLHLHYEGSSGALPANFPVERELNGLLDPLVSRYVIDENAETQERLYDEVLVAEQENGRVIFQHGPSGLNVLSLDNISNSKGSKLDLKLTEQSSSLFDVQLAGTEYKLFLQPIRLGLSATGDEKQQGLRWVVCGLTRTDHFRDKTFAVSYTVLIIFVAVVLLAFLSWPLLKLKLMGPKDKLRRADLGITALSALLGTALATFVLLDVHTYASLERTLDDKLGELSENIKANFQKEVAAAISELRELTAKLKGQAQSEQSGALKDFADSMKSPGVDTKGKGNPSLAVKVNIFAGGIVPQKAPYPYFNGATWTDPTGQQRVKWATKDEATASVDVSNRQFFLNASSGNLWNMNGPGSDYTLEMVKSRTTGDNTAIIVTPVPQSTWISNLDTRLLSLMGTVLPAGYGYAVIDSNGQVMFHSDEVKNLEEQFFAECDNDGQLRAAVLARTDRFINATYLGRSHRLWVSALTGTPWMLVVFRDKDLARTINLEMTSLSLMLYLGFVLIPAMVISGIVILIAVIWPTFVPQEGERMRWLWPDPRRAHRYEVVIAIFVLIGLILALALTVGSGWSLVVPCLVLPYVAAGLAALILIKDPVEDDSGNVGSGKVLSYRHGYAIVFAGLLTIAAVLPAAGFFKIARNFELRLMIKQGQVSLAKALERRNQRVTSQYASIDFGDQRAKASRRGPQLELPVSTQAKDAFLKRRLDETSDIYDSFFFKAPPEQASQSQFHDETLSGIEWVLARFRPVYNQSCVENQELTKGASSDGLWRWQLGDNRQIRLEKDKDGRKGEPSVTVMSTIPDVTAPDAFWKWAGVIVITSILAVSLYGLVRFVARRFFLLDMDLPCPTVYPGSYVLLRSSMAPNGSKWNPAEYYVTDLGPVKDWQTWRKELVSAAPKTAIAVVLDNFEHCMDDPEACREKLLVIEHFLSAGRRVVVVSTVDPCLFLFNRNAKLLGNGNAGSASIEPDYESDSAEVTQPATDNGQPVTLSPADADIQARWTAAFTNFGLVFAADNSNPNFVKANPEFLRVLRTTRPWRYIEVIGKDIVNGTLPRESDNYRSTAEEQISQVAEQARPYHQALWETCSEGQRCSLIHIARDGMISPKNRHLRRLVKRGLVVRDPSLRLMDESFRRFVLSASRDEDVEGWQRQEGGSAWQVMKAPLLLIVISVALFLFVTQKEIYDSTVSFVSAITLGIGALFKLLGLFQKSSGASAPEA